MKPKILTLKKIIAMFTKVSDNMVLQHFPKHEPLDEIILKKTVTHSLVKF